MLPEKRLLVLMSSYNGEDYIEQQIRSVMEQSIADSLHLRIRDDGSSDRTCMIIRQLMEEYMGKITLVEGKNIGCNASFFELLNSAKGYDYYSICDQDDVWLPRKLEAALDALEKEDERLPLLYASTSYLTGDDLVPYAQTRKKRRPLTIYNTAIQNICPGHTQVLNHALLKIIQKEPVDTERIYFYDSWIANYAVLYGKILFSNSSFTYYRQHSGNQLGSGDGKLGRLLASIHRKKTHDGHKYRRQIEYLAERNELVMRQQGGYEELRRFLEAENFWQRLWYVLNSKLYRQDWIETVAFYAGVLSGDF